MKNYMLSFALFATVFIIHIIGSCRKEVTPPARPGDTTRITSSYTEDFSDVTKLVNSGGWTTKGYYNAYDTSTATSNWTQGMLSAFKGDTGFYGFTAYSYTPAPTTSYGGKDQFAYSYLQPIADYRKSTSCWLITPILSVKNGDVISFYTRGDTSGVYYDRMQVLMSNSNSMDIGSSLTSVGAFTTTLFDINATEAPGGYPTVWTKYEYTFSGLPGKTDTRVAFRHYNVHPKIGKGVAIDLFKFTVK